MGGGTESASGRASSSSDTLMSMAGTAKSWACLSFVFFFEAIVNSSYVGVDLTVEVIFFALSFL